jgi:subtilisin family serine protease
VVDQQRHGCQHDPRDVLSALAGQQAAIQVSACRCSFDSRFDHLGGNMQRCIGLCVSVLVALVWLATPAFAAPASSLPATGKPIPNQYIVVLNEGANPRSVAAIAGADPWQIYDSVLNGFAATLNAGQLRALQNHPQVAYIEPNQEVSIAALQAVGSGQWGLDRIDQTTLPLNGTYTYTVTGAGINAYIISSGISTAHSQFGGRATNVYDVTGGSGQDCYGLGTHVAGVIGSATYGVAKQVNLLGVRYIDCRGYSTTANFIVALDWLGSNFVRPAVAYAQYNGSWSTAVDDATRRLYAKGMFVAYPAGDGQTAICTASSSFSSVYLVTASNTTDNRASFANYGPCVDLHAPGDTITSTWLAGGTNTIRSTAVAAAHVTGCAAKYKAMYGDATPPTLFSWLSSNAVPGANPSVKILYCPL